MSTDEGKEIVANGWKKAGIFDAIKVGSSREPDGDPDDCSEPELDDDGNAFDAFDDGLLLIRKKVSVFLE